MFDVQVRGTCAFVTFHMASEITQGRMFHVQFFVTCACVSFPMVRKSYLGPNSPCLSLWHLRVCKLPYGALVIPRAECEMFKSVAIARV